VSLPDQRDDHLEIRLLETHQSSGIAMDYAEEQAQELEILASIYTEDEFERISPLPALSDNRNIAHRIANTSHARHRQT
jgi:hypothetical protein